MKTLVLLRGLPGAGKSTFAKMLVGDKDYCHKEADMFFVKNGKYIFEPNKIREAHEWCQKTTEIFLNNGLSVVVSNTFTQRKEMQFYLDLAQSLNVPVKIHALWHAGSYDPHDFLGRLIGDAPWVRHAEKSFFHAVDYNYFATDFHIDMFV